MTEQQTPKLLKGASMNLTEHNIEQLKALFPNVFTEGKIDFDALKAELGEHLEVEGERYQFSRERTSTVQNTCITIGKCL